MESPLVTIMMPVFNGNRLIRASIDSLLAQTYPNWECVIVDDGSTDGTSAYLDSLIDKRFIVHHFPKNMGRPLARQKALELAKGKYLAMLDAEDLYSPQKLERQIKLLTSHPEVSLVCSSMCSFGTTTNILRKRGAVKEEIVEFSGRNVPVHASSMLLLERAKKFQYNASLNLGEDADFLSRYLVGCKYLLDPEILYYYSEFDSVSKTKILSSYKIKALEYTKKMNLKKGITNCLKYFIQSIRFRYISIEKILASRGFALSDREKSRFEKECKSLIANNL